MMAERSILIVEDDKTLLDVLKYNFAKEGYRVITASDGITALDAARKEHPDIVILDVMLPQMSGFEVCRVLRKEMSTPVLMLTARDEEVDRVVGLDIGADDYMTKPFSMRELMARVRALLRRSEMVETAAPAASRGDIKIGDLDIDIARHQVILSGNVLELTPKEFDLLLFLATNKGLVFSREQLLEKVWGFDYPGDTRTVDVHVRYLREKIEPDSAHPTRLLTVRGVGYKFEG
jgi:two-component system, OmpR family, response regulator